MATAPRRAALAKRVSTAADTQQQQLGVVIGFDGFVDEMIKLVGERRDLANYVPVPTIAAFGDIVTRSASHSTLREIVVTAMHAGGCAVNAADALAALGVPTDLFATLGSPVHGTLAPVAARCRSAHSWGSQPGRTLAFEFQDGKMMFSSVSQFADMTPARVAELLADGVYRRACEDARLIALTDWTLFPHMTSVWRTLHRDVYSALKHRPHFFIDLVDPSSRTDADVRDMLLVLPLLEECGAVTLGLNMNEANIMARLFGLPACSATTTSALAALLRVQLRISDVVIHCAKTAAVSSAVGDALIDDFPYCTNPKKSTGAGDRFNAGYMLGLLLGCDPLDRGCFVRNGESPSLDTLQQFLLHWAD